jgi:hypothetical protein
MVCTALLNKHIDTKTRQAGNGDGEIAFHILGEFRTLLLIHQRMREYFCDITRQLLRGEGLHRAVRLHTRRKIIRYE